VVVEALSLIWAKHSGAKPKSCGSLLRGRDLDDLGLSLGRRHHLAISFA